MTVRKFLLLKRYIIWISEFLYFSEVLWVFNPFHDSPPIFDMRMEIFYSRVKNVWQTFFPHEVVWQNSNTLHNFIVFFVFSPHLSQIMNCVDFRLVAFYKDQKLQMINFLFRKDLFHLTCILLDVWKHCFSIVFWYVFSIVS